ncbi:MAG: MFS transporter [Candidatus Eremiobacteraeota bacterium]|nr:MFS transporter [Candidatus Eremiobacteraeota bacterium]
MTHYRVTPPPAIGGKRHFLFTWPYLLALGGFFLISTGGQFFILYPLELKEMGRNDMQIGFLMGLTSLAAFAGRPFFGGWIDRKGRKLFIIIGSFTSGALILLYPWLQASFFSLSLLRVVHGLFFALFFTAIWTWIADYVPQDRLAEGIGIFGIAGLSSNATGPLAGEYMMRLANGNSALFFGGASLLVLLGSLCTLFLPAGNHHPGKAQSGFFGLLRRPEVLAVVFIAAVFGASIGAIHNFAAPYLKSAGLGSASSFFPYYAAGAILSRLVAGRAADRFGRVTVIIPGIFFQALGQLALAAPWHIPQAIGFFLGCGHGIVYPAMNALMFERAGTGDRGSGNALFTAAADAGSFVGSFLCGAIASGSGYAAMYIFSGIAALAGLGLYRVMETWKSRAGAPKNEEPAD